MKKIVAAVFLYFLATSVFAQESIVDAFVENFRKASDETKLELLKDSASFDPNTMGRLYFVALDYVISNSFKLDVNVSLRRIAILASQLAGVSRYQDSLPALWKLFETDRDTSTRITILNSLKVSAPRDQDFARRLTRWLDRQNNVFKAGGGVDAQVIREALKTLGTYRQSFSFPVILTTSVLGIHSQVTEAAREALRSLDGSDREMIVETLQSATIAEKVVVLQTAVEMENISADDISSIAHNALRIGVATSTVSERDRASLREMRILATKILTDRKWGEASAEMINHFNLTVDEYDRGAVVKSALLEAIAGLGSMGTAEAARRLAVYLDVVNSYIENNRSVDEQIVLSVINNLGVLGSKETLQPILYVRYLDYSKTVKDAAQAAMLSIRSR